MRGDNSLTDGLFFYKTIPLLKQQASGLISRLSIIIREYSRVVLSCAKTPEIFPEIQRSACCSMNKHKRRPVLFKLSDVMYAGRNTFRLDEISRFYYTWPSNFRKCYPCFLRFMGNSLDRRKRINRNNTGNHCRLLNKIPS